MNEYQDKLRSIGVQRQAGKARVKRERAENAEVITKEHWDGRQDATVRPDTVRYGARTHQTGKRKGETAEVIPFKAKERRERYGE